MLELQRDELVFRFPEVHADAELRVSFLRTLRIPDDGKTYPLPPGLSRFPIRSVDDHSERVPARWREHGGVMVPMFQSEALWISFQAHTGPHRLHGYPFAVRVAAGKINAVTGEPWSTDMSVSDHLVTPPQPWLDGFCVEKGKIRQFVAMPLGWGLTAEQQITGKEEHGGLQIEVVPMNAAEYERRYPQRREYHTSGHVLRGIGGQSCGGELMFGSCMADAPGTISVCSFNADMGLGAGGLMTQQIYEDTYGLQSWSHQNKTRTFVHLANSFAWQAITGQAPPSTPCTAAEYTRRGLPWFEHYVDHMPIASGGRNLAALKTVMQLGFQKGLNVLVDNEPVAVSAGQILYAGVRDGRW